MEEGTKQQQLTFEKGITNVPSDALCSDNALAECLGMIYENGEHRVIQNPKYDRQPDGKLVFVHKPSSGEDVYITENNGWLIIGNCRFEVSGGYLINAVGNTIIVSDSSGMHYFIWRGGTYTKYDNLPEIKFVPYLQCDPSIPTDPELSNEYLVTNTHREQEILAEDEGYLYFADKSNEKSQGEYDTIITGLYAKNKKAVDEAKGFCLPFFVRTALRMYDDSLTHISQPILLLPTLTMNSLLRFDREYDKFYLMTQFARMFFTQSIDLSGWSDIIKNVEVYISDGVEIYDTNVHQQIGQLIPSWYPIQPTPGQQFEDLGTVFNGVYRNGNSGDVLQTVDYVMSNDRELPIITLGITYPELFALSALKKRPIADIDADIKGTSVFYKVASIGLKPYDTAEPLAAHINTRVLENLTTQEQLEYDDFYSHTSLFPNLMQPFNMRLNLADVRRSFFEGFSLFMPYTESGTTTYRVNIMTDSGKKTVTANGSDQRPWYYFFYPDPRAEAVEISKGEHTRGYKLTEHEGLNGAYYFAGLQAILDQSPVPPAGDYYDSFDDGNQAPEELANYVITSEVGNPFVYLAKGYNKVGIGRILAISTTTMALSQDQFGRTDLLVFTDNGIWGMQVDPTGLYQSIHPFSREVSLSPANLIQTDGAVFFTSAKGLMVATDAGVKCVSEQLSGRETPFDGVIDLGNFIDYLRGGFMAYDYRDSLIWIFNSMEGTNPYCYVYSIKSGTFSKKNLGYVVKTAVNNYPDYLLQDTDNNVYSLLKRPNINQDGEMVGGQYSPNLYGARLITRPLKLENALALKSIAQIRHIRGFSDGVEVTRNNERVIVKPTLGIRLFASNNLNKWVELHSLRGIPWKYYRLEYDFSDLTATDRFDGSVIVTQVRRNNKLR